MSKSVLKNIVCFTTENKIGLKFVIEIFKLTLNDVRNCTYLSMYCEICQVRHWMAALFWHRCKFSVVSSSTVCVPISLKML